MSLKRQRSPGSYGYYVSDTNAPVTARKIAHREKPNPTARAPRQKATVKELASDGHYASVSDVEDRIIKRIKKCLERVNHPNTLVCELIVVSKTQIPGYCDACSESDPCQK
jgi:hypothetical protein